MIPNHHPIPDRKSSSDCCHTHILKGMPTIMRENYSWTGTQLQSRKVDCKPFIFIFYSINLEMTEKKRGGDWFLWLFRYSGSKPLISVPYRTRWASSWFADHVTLWFRRIAVDRHYADEHRSNPSYLRNNLYPPILSEIEKHLRRGEEVHWVGKEVSLC